MASVGNAAKAPRGRARATAGVAGRWLLAPATETGPGGLAVTTTVIRVLVGVMWLYNTAWKVPPDFGQAKRAGLFTFTSYAVSDPVLPPYSWVVQHVVLHQFVAFGWLVLVLETVLAVLLLSGAFVRIACLLGAAQSLAIGLSIARAPHEWPWSYLLMVAVHLLILFGGGGRYLAVDALRAGRSVGTALARFWGALSVAMGLLAIVISAFGSPFGPNGANLQLTGLEFGLGSYNVAGGLVLLVAGAAVLAWSWTTRSWLGWSAAALTAVAAILLRVQIGFSPPVLGGTAASVAFFLALAVVAAALARCSAARGDDPHEADTGARREVGVD